MAYLKTSVKQFWNKGIKFSTLQMAAYLKEFNKRL